MNHCHEQHDNRVHQVYGYPTSTKNDAFQSLLPVLKITQFRRQQASRSDIRCLTLGSLLFTHVREDVACYSTEGKRFQVSRSLSFGMHDEPIHHQGVYPDSADFLRIVLVGRTHPSSVSLRSQGVGKAFAFALAEFFTRLPLSANHDS